MDFLKKEECDNHLPIANAEKVKVDIREFGQLGSADRDLTE